MGSNNKDSQISFNEPIAGAKNENNPPGIINGGIPINSYMAAYHFTTIANDACFQLYNPVGSGVQVVITDFKLWSGAASHFYIAMSTGQESGVGNVDRSTLIDRANYEATYPPQAEFWQGENYAITGYLQHLIQANTWENITENSIIKLSPDSNISARLDINATQMGVFFKWFEITL